MVISCPVSLRVVRRGAAGVSEEMVTRNGESIRIAFEPLVSVFPQAQLRACF